MPHRNNSFGTGTAWLILLGTSWLSLPAVTTAAPDSQRDPGRQPHRFTAPPPHDKLTYVWLWYADGKAIPGFTEYFCDYVPPAYKCNFGSSLDDCRAQVQTYLDAWYKDFNLVFTFTKPPSGDYYTYTVAITSGWPQCKLDAADLTGGIAANEGGIAPGNSCLDNPGHTAIAIECGKNAHDCATLIAHEHGHLVGLVHETSSMDVMNPSVQITAAGFVDQSLPAVQDMSNSCQVPKQNSYEQMLSVLGPWSGGNKPSPFPSASDAGVSDAASPDVGDAASPDTAAVPDAPAIGGVIGPGLGSGIDGNVTALSGIDAYSRPPPPAIPDTGTPTTPAGKSGCDFTRTPTSASLLVAAGLLLGCRLLARRSALSRAASRSGRAATRRP